MAYDLIRSPKYILSTTTGGTNLSHRLELDVRLLTTVEATGTPEYIINKTITDTTVDDIQFEFSRFVRDFITDTPIHNASTALINSAAGNIAYVNVNIYNNIGDALIVGALYRCIEGYGTYQGGANPTLADGVIPLSNTYYVVNKGGFFNVPVPNEGEWASISVDGVVYTLTPTTAIPSLIQNMYINLSGYTAGEIIEVIPFGGTPIQLEIREECRYEPVDVMFKNKFGCWEIISFMKKRQDSFRVSSEKFKNNSVAGATYDTTRHQIATFNKNGTASVTLNTDYLPESYNQTIEELMLSEAVYFLNGGNHIPVNVSTNSLSLKTRINDKLISYSLKFDYAFDMLNNV